eukprot:5438427-Karenia_brevis.AAC.1
MMMMTVAVMMMTRGWGKATFFPRSAHPFERLAMACPATPCQVPPNTRPRWHKLLCRCMRNRGAESK